MTETTERVVRHEWQFTLVGEDARTFRDCTGCCQEDFWFVGPEKWTNTIPGDGSCDSAEVPVTRGQAEELEKLRAVAEVHARWWNNEGGINSHACWAALDAWRPDWRKP